MAIDPLPAYVSPLPGSGQRTVLINELPRRKSPARMAKWNYPLTRPQRNVSLREELLPPIQRIQKGSILKSVMEKKEGLPYTVMGQEQITGAEP